MRVAMLILAILCGLVAVAAVGLFEGYLQLLFVVNNTAVYPGQLARVAPDIVAEVVSPSQYRPGVAEKAQRYLAAGVRLVWIIWPRHQQVEVWRPGVDRQPEAKLSLGGALDGLDVLAGFAYLLVRLFA